MNKVYCDRCGTAFDKWPEVTLNQRFPEPMVDGFDLIPDHRVPDIHLHWECFLALGFIRYKDVAEKAGVSPA